MNLERVLKDKFGYSSFRTPQKEIIMDALNNKDQLVILPTGSGKSICYQLPATIQKGITIVISPLKSLIIDQVANLKNKNIESDALYGDIGEVKKKIILDGMLCQNYSKNIIYTTPETLEKNGEFFENLKLLEKCGRLTRFVVDEAHCISMWGNDFRSSYRKLSDIKFNFKKIPIMALTATATEQTRNDIEHLLCLKKHKIYTISYFRPNLNIKVIKRTKIGQTISEIVNNIKTIYTNQTGIIYCSSRKKCEELSSKFNENGIVTLPYHAGLSNKIRKKTQDMWKNDEVKVITATIAFGMGIDKDNVRFVIHFNMPFSIENYYQEIGRAGRDGLKSDCILYYNYQDKIMAEKLMRMSKINVSNHEKHIQHQVTKLDKMINYAENIVDCRHCQVCNYLGELRCLNNDICCESCNNCVNFKKNQLQKINVSDIAKLIFKGIMENKIPKRSNIDMFFRNYSNFNQLAGKYFKSSIQESKKQLIQLYERVFTHLIVNKFIKEKYVLTKSGFWRENYQIFKKSINIIENNEYIYIYA